MIDKGVNQGLQASSNSALTSARVPVSLNVDSEPLAVLAMPQKINGERDLMILSAGHSSASLVPLAVLVTLTVNNITDQIRNPGNLNLNCVGGGGDCSLREAVLKANINAGPSTINIPGNIGTYNLSVNNPASGTTGTIALPDLEVGSATNTNATLLGVSGTPIINQTIANNDVITTGFAANGSTPQAVTLILNNLEI